MTFLHPWFLLLWLVVPLILWRWWVTRDQAAIAYSTLPLDWNPQRTWRQTLAWLPATLTILALTLMITSLARPRHGQERTIVYSEGVAIEMVVDRSSSMRALDFKIDNQPVNRLQAIKRVASDFVLGDDQENDQEGDEKLGGRIADLIGLITFAGYADALSTPTLDHSFLVDQLESVQLVRQEMEDGTAIGDAIALAVEKLQSLDRNRSNQLKSKVIILLTDGENTAGELKPEQAAELAKAMGIKVYTIGVGTNGRAPYPIRELPDGRVQVQYVPVTIDEVTLRAVAQLTGGAYFRATDTAALRSIYDQIDQLEKTQVESQTLYDFREWAIHGIHFRSVAVPPLLLIALVLIVLRVVASAWLLRGPA